MIQRDLRGHNQLDVGLGQSSNHRSCNLGGQRNKHRTILGRVDWMINWAAKIHFSDAIHVFVHKKRNVLLAIPKHPGGSDRSSEKTDGPLSSQLVNLRNNSSEPSNS